MNGPVFRHLTDDGLVGDGTNYLIVGDGGSTAVPYYAGPATGKYWHIERMLIFIEDVGAPKISEYGSATALGNGLTLDVRRGGAGGSSILDLTDGARIKSNGDWAHHCYDISLTQPGSGNGVVPVRWTFGKSGQPLVLDGAKAEKLVLENNDQLNVLISHTAIIQGYETNVPHPM